MEIRVPSAYVINVSQGGCHVFATHECSLTGASEDGARGLLSLIRRKFPESEGYTVDIKAKYSAGKLLPW